MVSLFRRFGILTIVSVYVLILVGGVVRASGSGMGCPDWPKCFGSWVPPTSVDQLPVNYKEVFGEKLKGEVIFNPVKTWIEYVNRLVGVLIGFFIFITFVISFIAFRKSDKLIVGLSFLSFLLVGFEGWLGAKVVSSELHPGMITIHMLVSIVIVLLLIYVVFRSFSVDSRHQHFSHSRPVNFLLVIGVFLMIAQIVFGTQLREGVDLAQKLLGDENRDSWIGTLGGKIFYHAFLSALILLVTLIFNRKLGRLFNEKGIRNWGLGLVIVVSVSILTGALMGIFGIPPVFQPVHLLLSVLILGIQFVLYMMLNPGLVYWGLNEGKK